MEYTMMGSLQYLNLIFLNISLLSDGIFFKEEKYDLANCYN